ncbi:MAG: DUF4390 domain-containing protein [Nitrospinota bacterium]|nr:DUF4390 domain-containing protein [Nitrospinota bacterium]
MYSPKELLKMKIFAIVLINLFFINFAYAANTKVGKEKPEKINTDPILKDILVIKKNKKMLIFISSENTVTEEFWEIVRKGVKTRFVYELELYKKVPYFFDSMVLEKEIAHEVKFDPIKKVFVCKSRNGAEDYFLKFTKESSEISDWMSQINGIDLIDSDKLDPSQLYYIKVRVKFNSLNFAFPFNYFLSFTTKETDWFYSTYFANEGM